MPLAPKYCAISAPVPYPPPMVTDWKMNPGISQRVHFFFVIISPPKR